MNSHRIPSLDGLRAISIALVIVSHLARWKHIAFAFPEAYGELGVRIFFVLSGFLISQLLFQEQERSSSISLRDFYVRRAFRIFPAAFVFLAVVTVVYWHEMRWYHLAAAVFYAANMDSSRPWIFGHLWSLSIEEQFYLLWPFALKKWRQHKVAILLCAVILTPVFHAALYAFKARGGIVGSLPLYTDQLAMGCLLAIYARRLPKIGVYLALAMTAAMFLIPLYPAISPARTLFMLFVLQPALNLSIAAVILHVMQVPYRVLNWSPVAWLGRISYSLYLWQEAFCSNPAQHHWYSLTLATLVCASVSYYCVEQPMLRLREKWTRKSGSEQPSALQPNSLPA